MKILHIASINTQISNGPRFSVPNFVEAQNNIKGIKSSLLNVTPNLCDDEEIQSYNFDYFKFSKNYEKNLKDYDIVIFHSFWHFEFFKIVKILKRKKIPYIIVPRGAFTFEALGRKKLKKLLAYFLFFRYVIRNSLAIQFLTKNEMINSKQMKKTSFILPNGMKLKKIEIKKDKLKKEIIYMGRIDPYTKGLDSLIEAIKIGCKEFREIGVKVKLYGSDFPIGGKKILENKIKDYNIGDLVTINSAIFNKEKEEVLKKSNYFIAPSRFEGLPMAILDALSYKIPVFLTKETNLLEEVNKYNCGWEISHSSIQIKEVLLRVLSQEYNFEKSENSEKLIKEEFEWKKIGEDSIIIYKNLGLLNE